MKPYEAEKSLKEITFNNPPEMAKAKSTGKVHYTLKEI